MLLSIFLFNVGGYFVVFWALRFQAKQELVAQLDGDNYNHNETVLIRIPFTMPYPLLQGYQPLEGEFEYHGEFLKLVKQKVENDTLNVVCVRDHKQKQLFGALKDFIKVSNDLPSSHSNQAMQLLSKVLKEYRSISGISLITSTGWCREYSLPDEKVTILSQEHPVHSPPPKSTLS